MTRRTYGNLASTPSEETDGVLQFLGIGEDELVGMVWEASQACLLPAGCVAQLREVRVEHRTRGRSQTEGYGENWLWASQQTDN